MKTSLSSLEHPLQADIPLFFMHIPKTAGTTLIQVIEQQFDEHEIARWLYPFRLVDEPAEFFSRHRYFHGHVDDALMRSLLPQNPVSMTVLRQPVERYLSHFGNHKRVAFHQIPDISYAAFTALTQTSLEDFVRNPPQPLTVVAQYFQNLQAKLLAAPLSTENVAERNALIRTNQYILPTPTLEQALQRLETFEFVGLTERFQDSLFLLAYTFGWFPATIYKNFNTAQPRPQQHALAPELLIKIGELNQLDQQVYQRGCDLFQTRFEQMQQELLTRYGKREHAHEHLPLAPEHMTELLDRHYQQRFVEHTRVVPALKLNFDQKMSGANWHLAEQHPVYGAVRWSGPGRRAHLDVPLSADGPVRLRFSLVLAITQTVLASLRVTVNGQPLDLAAETLEHNVKIYQADIPQPILARQPGLARIAFEIEETIRPVDVLPGSADERLLGVCLNWVEITPLESQENAGFYQRAKQFWNSLKK